MDIIGKIAEERIRESISRGELENLPGKGKPLSSLDGDRDVPEELRLGYRVLRNAGCIPPELELRKEVMNLRDLVRAARGAEKDRLMKELDFKLMKFNTLAKRPLNLEDFPEYADRVCEVLTRSKREDHA